MGGQSPWPMLHHRHWLRQTHVPPTSITSPTSSDSWANHLPATRGTLLAVVVIVAVVVVFVVCGFVPAWVLVLALALALALALRYSVVLLFEFGSAQSSWILNDSIHQPLAGVSGTTSD